MTTTSSSHSLQGKQQYLVYVNGQAQYTVMAFSAADALGSIGTTNAHVQVRLVAWEYRQ